MFVRQNLDCFLIGDDSLNWVMEGFCWRAFFLFVIGFLIVSGTGLVAYAQTIGYEIPSGVTTYANSVSVSASDSEGDNQDVDNVYGIYTDHDLDSFGNANSGSISVSATGGNASANGLTVDVYYILGGYFINDVGSFSNLGSISASAVGGNAIGDSLAVNVYGIYGVYFGNNVESFSNLGSVSASAVAGNAIGDNSIVDVYNILGGYFGNNVGSFSNSGSISASAVIGDASGDNAVVKVDDGIYGIAFNNNNVDYFSNLGSVSASAVIGNLSGSHSEADISYILGVYFRNNVGSFSNLGSISAGTVIGDASGDNAVVKVNNGIYGVYFGNNVESFSNSGSVSASAVGGNAIGDNSTVDVYNILGGYFGNNVGSFSNSGSISASAQVGELSGDSATADIDYIVGVYFEKGVDSFYNQDTVNASVEVGGNANVSHVAAVYTKGDANINNSGNIVTRITAGANSNISDVAGIYVENVTDADINNSGNIYLSIDPASSTSVNNAAGIYILNSNATISNPGTVYLYTDLSNADIRTLSVKNSNVTLEDRFSIVFGSSGITEEPIYVDSSTLDLNGVTLLAHAGDDLEVNHPYRIIESTDTSTINNSFGRLENQTGNPDILSSWYGPDRGKDAAVIFRYHPRHSMAGLAIHGAYTAMSSSLDRVFNFAFGKELASSLMSKAERPILLASLSDVSLGGLKGSGFASTTHRNGFFLLPYYTHLNGDDLKYDSDTWGFNFGFERQVNDDFTVGMFGGFAWSDLDFKGKYDHNSEDQEHQTGGIYVLYNKNRWYGGLLASYWHTDHDYDGRTGSNLTIKEDDDYDSHAFHSRILGGYGFELSNDFHLIPFAGLSYTHWYTPGHTTDATNSRWDKHYEGDNEDFLPAILGVNLVKGWTKEETNISLEGGLKLEQALIDDDISVKQAIPGIDAPKVGVEEDVSDTSMLGHLGLTVSKGRMKVTVAFDSRYNDDYQTYSGFVNCGIAF